MTWVVVFNNFNYISNMKTYLTLLILLLTLSVKAQQPTPIDTVDYALKLKLSNYMAVGACVNYESQSGNYTITSTDFTGHLPILQMWVNTSGGNVTITLPAYASFVGYKVIIGKTDNSSNTITISGLPSDNVVGVQNSVKEAFASSSGWVQN